ncbi:MAG: hemerythrin domain-containing protein [Cytophagales bacterium]|nr:hemerythrin domain-containing protein [Cytophagales bacterium]
MELFTRDSKMTDLVHSNYLLLTVLNRFDIKLGFQDKTVRETCAERSINMDFFLAIINTFHNHAYFPEDELQSFSSNLIINYLRKSHQDFIKVNLPNIEMLLMKLVDSSNSADLKVIQSFYNTYKDELLDHIKDEEENTFPYVLELQKYYDLKINYLPENLVNYSIKSFEKEHTNVDEKLFDLKNIIIKFLEPTYNDRYCNEFLFKLFQFENDLTDHARIEDKILVPKVLKIEKELKNAS